MFKDYVSTSSIFILLTKTEKKRHTNNEMKNIKNHDYNNINNCSSMM